MGKKLGPESSSSGSCGSVVRGQQKGRKVKKVEQISLRVFCHAYGDNRTLLLHGYDKGEDPKGRRQQREIEIARKRLRKWRSRRRF